MYRYKGLRLEIAPEVFHPGFFFSTRFLLQYITALPLQQKKIMELGCGSGLISMVAAQKGAVVTASDINRIALAYLKKNCRQNNIEVEIIASDLFADIPVKAYDIIAINPPYYKKDPITAKDHAWFCGENGEYFSGMFAGLSNYIHRQTEVLMVLFDGCDMNMINNFAAKNNFSLTCVQSRQNMLERNFIFKIEKTNE